MNCSGYCSDPSKYLSNKNKPEPRRGCENTGGRTRKYKWLLPDEACACIIAGNNKQRREKISVDGEYKTAPIRGNVLNQKQYQTEMKKPLLL